MECVKTVIHESFTHFINIWWKENWLIAWTFQFRAFLWIAIILLVFKIFGYIPDENDTLKRKTSWLDISWEFWWQYYLVLQLWLFWEEIILKILLQKLWSFKKYVCCAGVNRILKKRTKTSRGRGSSLSICWLCEKKLPDFSNSKTEFFQTSYLTVLKVVLFWTYSSILRWFFIKKSHAFFFSFNIFLEYVNIFNHCMFNCVKNIKSWEGR